MATPAILGSDGRPTSASTFLVVHRALRRDLARFPVAVRSLAQVPDATRLAAFQEHWKSYRDILDTHHEQEDKVLFPALRDEAPGLGDVLDLLDTKHADLAGMLDNVSQWVEQLPEEADQAIAALDELAEFLEFHLDTEEAHLVPVMVSSLEPPRSTEPADPDPTVEGAVATSSSPDEARSAGTDRAVEEITSLSAAGVDFSPVPPSFALPWCADGLDADVVRVLLADLPEPLRAEYPAWNDAYQRFVALWM